MFLKRVNIIIVVVFVIIPNASLEYPGEKKRTQPIYGVEFRTELGTHWWKSSVCNTLSPPVANTLNMIGE